VVLIKGENPGVPMGSVDINCILSRFRPVVAALAAIAVFLIVFPARSGNASEKNKKKRLFFLGVKKRYRKKRMERSAYRVRAVPPSDAEAS